MSRVLTESKRSIHSTRIDVIAGDPLPIKADDALPINSLGRPAVNDPEYKPETVPELAVALSALARLIPPGHVTDLYIRIRDLISKIVPVDTSSIDLVAEGVETWLTDEEEGKVAAVLDNAQRHMLALREKDPELYKQKGLVIARIVKDLTTLLRLASKSTEKSVTRQEREKIHAAVLRSLQLYSDNLMHVDEPVDASGTDRKASMSLRKRIDRADKVGTPDAINLMQIRTAYHRQSQALAASGESFDLAASQEMRRRLRDIERIFASNPTFSSIFAVILDASKNAGFRADLIDRKATRGSKAQGFDVVLSPIFRPGTTHAVLTSEPVKYSREGDFVESVGHVHVYRRFAQTFDGQEVEIQPDIFIDLGSMRGDFVLAATENLSDVGVAAAEKQAAAFFDQNREHIISEMLTPDAVYAMTQSSRTKKMRKIASAEERHALSRAQIFTLQLAQERIDDILSGARGSQVETTTLSVDRAKRDSDSARSLRAGDFFDERDVQLRLSVRHFLNSAVIPVQPADAPIFDDDYDADDPTAKRPSKTLVDAPAASGDAAAGVSRAYFELKSHAAESFRAISANNLILMRERGIRAPGSADPVTDADRKAASQRVEQLLRVLNAQSSESTKTASYTLSRALPKILDAASSAAFVGMRELRASGSADTATLRSLQSAVNRLDEISAVISGNDPGINRASLLAQTVLLIPNTVNLPDLLSDTRGTDSGTRIVKSAMRAISDAASTAAARTHGLVPFREIQDDAEKDDIASEFSSYISSVYDAARSIAGGTLDESKISAVCSAFGMERAQDLPPIIVTATIKNAVKQSESLKSRATVDANRADVIYGLPLGTCERLVSHASADPESMLQDVVTLSRTVFQTAVARLRPILRSNVALPPVFRTVVYAAVRFGDTTDGQPTGRGVVDTICEMIEAGFKGTSIDFASRRGTAAAHRISIVTKDPGVGFFTDSSAQSVARVVGGPDLTHASTVEVEAGLSFLDNTVALRFVDAQRDIVDAVSKMLNLSASGSASTQLSAVVDEVRDFLVESLQTVAAEINRSFVAGKTILPFDSASSVSSPDEVEEHIQKLERVAKSDASSSLSRAISIAALNYTRNTGRISSETVDYYAPVKQADPPDPESGAPLLLGSHDFVRQSLSMADIVPELPVYSGQLDRPERTSFLEDVWRLIESHILTDVIDVHGRAIRRERPDIEAKTRAWQTGTAGGKSDVGEAKPHTPMSDRLASDVVRRLPEKIDARQVLSLVPKIRAGIPFNEIVHLIEDAKTFLRKLMLEAGPERGYVNPGVYVSKDKRVADDKLNEVFTSAAVEIENEIVSRVESLARKIAGDTIKIAGVGDEKDTYLTPQEMRDISARKAEAAIIERVASEHYADVGLATAVKLHHSQATGMPEMPPSPADFFREKGIVQSQKIRDPFKYVAKMRAAANQYRKMLADKYGISAGDEARAKRLEDVAQQYFPGLMDKAVDAATKGLTNIVNAQLYEMQESLEQTPPSLSINAGSGVVLGLGSVDDVSSGDPNNLYTVLVRIAAIAKIARDYREKMFTFLSDTAEGREIITATQRHEVMLRGLEESSRAYIERTDASAMRGDTTSKKYGVVKNEVASAVESYTAIVGMISSHLRDRIDRQAEQQASVSASMIDDALADLVSAELEEINKALFDLRRSPSPERAKEIRQTLYALGGERNAPAARNRIADALERLNKSSIADSARDEIRRTGSIDFRKYEKQSVGSDAIAELTVDWKHMTRDMIAAREKTQKAVSRARSDVSYELSQLAEKLKLADKISKLVGRSVSPHIYFFDTRQQLEAYESELRDARRREMIESLYGGKSEDQLSNDQLSAIEAATSSYVDHVLSGKIFGVRTSEPAT